MGWLKVTYILNVLVDLEHALAAVFRGPGEVFLLGIIAIRFVLINLDVLGLEFNFVYLQWLDRVLLHHIWLK
jgi:hypothetical protein